MLRISSRVIQGKAAGCISRHSTEKVLNNLNAAAAASFHTNTFVTSAQVALDDALDVEEYFSPKGDLFDAEIGEDLVGKSASIVRIFGPQSNAQALLACGGSYLARDASFDPRYDRAQKWIRSHAVGHAVGSPSLAAGLFCGLVEASFPNSIPVRSDMKHIRPIVVGIEMEARVTVKEVIRTDSSYQLESFVNEASSTNKKGYEVLLDAELTRIRDSAKIVEGSHSVWLSDYTRM